MSMALPSVPPQVLSDALRKVAGLDLDPAGPAWEQASAEAMHALIESDSPKAEEVLALLLEASSPSEPGPIKAGVARLRMAKETGPVNDELFGDVPTRSPRSPREDPVFSEAMESVRRFTAAHSVELAPPSVLGFRERNVRLPEFEAAERLLMTYERQLESKSFLRESLFARCARAARTLWRGATEPSLGFADVIISSTRYAPNLTLVDVKHRHASPVQMASLLSGTALYLVINTNRQTKRYRLDLTRIGDEPDFKALFESDFEAAGQSISALRAAMRDSMPPLLGSDRARTFD